MTHEITEIIQSLAHIKGCLKTNDNEGIIANLDYIRYQVDYLNGYIDGLQWRLKENG
jgi:hypothetical protein